MPMSENARKAFGALLASQKPVNSLTDSPETNVRLSRRTIVTRYKGQPAYPVACRPLDNLRIND